MRYVWVLWMNFAAPHDHMLLGIYRTEDACRGVIATQYVHLMSSSIKVQCDRQEVFK